MPMKNLHVAEFFRHHQTSAAYQKLLRVTKAALGLGGLTSIAFIASEMFTDFVLWKLLLITMALPGAAMFLLFAFQRRYQQSAPGFGGHGGVASLGVTWPRPTRPPMLVAAAAE